MRKDTREDKNKNKKVEELAKTQRTTLVGETSTSGEVTEESKIPAVDGEWDDDYKTFIETYKGTKDQEDQD